MFSFVGALPDRYHSSFGRAVSAEVNGLSVMEHYSSVESLLAKLKPAEPVYCIYPHVYERAPHDFITGFFVDDIELDANNVSRLEPETE